MLQRYNRYKILQVFFNWPRKDFQMREISRLVKISQPSVINHLNFLLKEGFILKEKKGIYPTFKANRDNELFKLYKKLDLLIRLQDTSLINYIYDNCLPSVIILFGSASKGEDTEESDIDLFVNAPQKKLNLDKYEKLLHRGINVFYEGNVSRLTNEFRNNLVNGIVLKGYLKIF